MPTFIMTRNFGVTVDKGLAQDTQRFMDLIMNPATGQPFGVTVLFNGPAIYGTPLLSAAAVATTFAANDRLLVAFYAERSGLLDIAISNAAIDPATYASTATEVFLNIEYPGGVTNWIFLTPDVARTNFAPLFKPTPGNINGNFWAVVYKVKIS